MTSITIFIAEDHAVVREGTRQILEQYDDLRVVGEAERGDVAIERIVGLLPDVALLDLRLPGLNGIEVAARLAASAPTVRVLILSAYDYEDYVVAALNAGAAGYVLKTAPGREVAEAVRWAQRGETVLAPALARKLAQYWQRAGRRGSGGALSPRELEVVRLLASGQANKDIAASLGISLRTVEGHLANVFAKLGVTSRTEAVLYAVQHRLVTLEEGSRL